MTPEGIVSQFASQVCPHDAIGNEIFAMRDLLAGFGLESATFCDYADPALAGAVNRWSKRAAEDGRLTIVHFSHGSPSHERVFATAEPKMLVYHNITPAHYFLSTHPRIAAASRKGREQLASLPESVDVAVAHSSFSAAELRDLGFRRVEVLPYIPFESLYAVDPDPDLLRRYGGDGAVNLICVAQIAPHKCIEDCILVFDYFRRVGHRNSRLFVIGGWSGTEAYLARLHRLVKMLGVEDVIFTGQVPQAALVAYYRIADALLCMSEHEGFCVPLIEAMRYDVPIFAYEAGAIPETLGSSGVSFRHKDWPLIAEAIGALLSTPRLKEQVLEKQRVQFSNYSMAACRKKFSTLLASMGIASTQGQQKRQ